MRTLDDDVATDSAVTIIKAASSGHSWRATGVSIYMWCGYTWEILVDGSTVYTGGGEGVVNFAFPTPLEAGDNQSIALRATLKSEGTAKIHMTLLGDEQ